LLFSSQIRLPDRLSETTLCLQDDRAISDPTLAENIIYGILAAIAHSPIAGQSHAK
jgi:hypothetical protein